MGLDVTFYPVRFGDSDKGYFAFTKLEVERRRDLWDDLAKVPSHPCAALTAHIGDNYGKREGDCYGEKLRYTTAADLLSLAQHQAVIDEQNNRAVWAYLRELDADTKIVLYWH